jgi:hypothetical protein
MRLDQFFASILREQLFDLKMKTPFKNVRICATQVLAKVYIQQHMHGPIQTRETVL